MLKDCMNYMHEKCYKTKTANKSMLAALGQIKDSVLETLNTMIDEFGITLESYKYRVDECFGWLVCKKFKQLDTHDEFTKEFENLQDSIRSLCQD